MGATAVNVSIADMRAVAARIRGELVRMSHDAESPHLGSALSCIDILVAAYWAALDLDPARAKDPRRDRLILSKGHAAPALYATLAHRGYFPVEELRQYGAPGGHLPDQPAPGCAPGVELATGSLGHGLPVGVGHALAAKLRSEPWRTLVVMSDGECNEGSVWEAAMLAPAHALERLAVVVDYNKWQATGRTDQVMAMNPLADKWRAFGWSTREVDGHDLEALVGALRLPDGSGKPLAVVAHTVKGKGISFMEDDNNWHYRIPNSEEVAAARKELGLQP